MHTYQNFHAPSGEAIVDFVRNFPFAVISTSTEGAPVATHTPVILPTHMNIENSLVGTQMRGHMGRENPHWKLFLEQPQALMIFSSSHAYISPSSYDFMPAAPTLDYATVHLTGKIKLLTSVEENLAVVEQTVDQLEGRRSQKWDKTSSKEWFREIINGVVSFTFDVEHESAMFKLSQNMTEEVQNRIRQDLTTGDQKHTDVAQLMKRCGRVPSAYER